MFNLFKKQKLPTTLFISASLAGLFMLFFLLSYAKSAIKNNYAVAESEDYYIASEMDCGQADSDPLITKTEEFCDELNSNK